MHSILRLGQEKRKSKFSIRSDLQKWWNDEVFFGGHSFFLAGGGGVADLLEQMEEHTARQRVFWNKPFIQLDKQNLQMSSFRT